MNDSNSSPERRGRWQFLLILALFAVPLLAAVGWYALAPGAAPAPAVHGTLIHPAQPIEAFETGLTADGAGAFRLDDLRGRWTLLHVIDGDCDSACGERLYFTRQIRTALGRDRRRVQRVVLAVEGERTPGLAPLLAEHPQLRVVPATENGTLRRQLPSDLDPATVLLVDPLGNLMLRFGPDVQPDGILEDLEKLMKLSQVG